MGEHEQGVGYHCVDCGCEWVAMPYGVCWSCQDVRAETDRMDRIVEEVDEEEELIRAAEERAEAEALARAMGVDEEDERVRAEEERSEAEALDEEEELIRDAEERAAEEARENPDGW